MVGRRYSARVTIAPIDAGPVSGGISPVTVPATAVGAIVTVTPTALAVAPVGFVMSDGTAHAGSKESVVSNEVPGDAADHRSFYAPGFRWAGRYTDNSQHRGCRNKHRFHKPSPFGSRMDRANAKVDPPPPRNGVVRGYCITARQRGTFRPQA